MSLLRRMTDAAVALASDFKDARAFFCRLRQGEQGLRTLAPPRRFVLRSVA